MAEQHTPTTRSDQIITLRIPRTVTNEVRQLAARESESQATVYRRLIKSGLQVEVRAQRAEQ